MSEELKSGKSKKICWKAVAKSSKYARMFNRYGETVNLDENSITLSETFVCSLYRKNKKNMKFFKQCMRKKVKPRNCLFFHLAGHLSICNVNIQTMLQTMYEKKGKTQDLSLLPPCRSSLHC